MVDNCFKLYFFKMRWFYPKYNALCKIYGFFFKVHFFKVRCHKACILQKYYLLLDIRHAYSQTDCIIGHSGNYAENILLNDSKINLTWLHSKHYWVASITETTTLTSLSSFSNVASVSKSVSTSLTTPITPASDTRASSHKEKFQSDDKFTVVLSVTAVSSVIIILTIVITKLRCDTKDTIIYYINRSRRHRPVSFHDQFQVPFRNLETDIYMEIEEMDDVDDTSIKSFGNFQNEKKKENEGLQFEHLTKPDSLRTSEKASFRTNVDNVLKPKPDTLKHKEKYFKKFEKYKTFTTRRFTNSKVHLKRYNSWHNVIEVPNTLQSIRRTRSVLNISDDKFKHCILKM